MSQVPPNCLDVRTVSGQGLRVEFTRVKDRYAHLISLLDGDLAVPAWQSVEGSDADDWPPSPPLQQLSLETLPDGRRVALLVGMAGTSHWSMSVEPALDGVAFDFDVACRVKQRALRVGSTYRRLCADDSLEGRLSVRFASDNATSALQFAHSEVGIVPSQMSDSIPATIRWKFNIAVEALPDSPAGK